MPKTSDKDSTPSFEEAMDELDGIVQAMEGDRLSLAELIEQYAKGMKLEKVCREQLAVARQRVESITEAADGGGEIEVTPFDTNQAAETGTGQTSKNATPKREHADSKTKPETQEDDEIRLF